MEVKAFELRDIGTFVPSLAIRVNPHNEAERYLISRAGYGPDPDSQGQYIIFMGLHDLQAHYSPHDWGSANRTRTVAHQYIVDHWDELEHGQVIDVQFILGETDAPKLTEAVTIADT